MELDIKTVTGGPLDVNTYVVGASGSNQCVLIDPGAEYAAVNGAVCGREVTAVLLTHAHFDHIGALKNLHAATQAPVFVGEADKDDPSHMCHDLLLYTDTYREGDELTAAGLRFRVLSTPGHTPGSVCLLCENTLFSGDTLFAGSYGRTDFPGGSDAAMSASLKRLSVLPPETRVLPGHGPASTIADELRTNPYLRGGFAG